MEARRHIEREGIKNMSLGGVGGESPPAGFRSSIRPSTDQTRIVMANRDEALRVFVFSRCRDITTFYLTVEPIFSESNSPLELKPIEVLDVVNLISASQQKKRRRRRKYRIFFLCVFRQINQRATP